MTTKTSALAALRAEVLTGVVITFRLTGQPAST